MMGRTNDRPAEPEAGPEWIRRAEVRAILGLSEAELRWLEGRVRLSKRAIPLYLKAEVLALREYARTLE